MARPHGYNQRAGSRIDRGRLPASQIARAVGVTVSAVRNWSTGQAEPRTDAAITLDDLRATTKALLDGGMEPERVARWLISRDPKSRQRPLDAIASRPTEVLAAAFDEVLEKKLADDDSERSDTSEFAAVGG